MDKAYRMLEAKILQEQGVAIGEIARRLGRTERTIWNYLHPKERSGKVRGSKLDPYKALIDARVEEDPDLNCEILSGMLYRAGFTGKKTILRDYVAKRRHEVRTQAVIRFETIPGQQAQVDWKDFGKQLVDGQYRKLYAFVMILGYSRKPFIRFTTRVDEATLFACHVLAFQSFGGVPKEILYDNMKTAFIANAVGEWRVNARLLQVAAHYGFAPKRCKVRRPETKGKVERMVGYLDNNFWPRMKDVELSLDDLNEQVAGWVETISDRKLVDFNASRRERFAAEAIHLQKLPATDYDVRQIIPVTINRESMLTFKTNRYSVPPRYIGKTLSLLVHPFHERAEVTSTDGWRREYVLQPTGSQTRIMDEADSLEIMKRWKRDSGKVRAWRQPKRRIAPGIAEVAVRSPAVYDAICNLAACEAGS